MAAGNERSAGVWVKAAHDADAAQDRETAVAKPWIVSQASALLKKSAVTRKMSGTTYRTGVGAGLALARARHGETKRGRAGRSGADGRAGKCEVERVGPLFCS